MKQEKANNSLDNSAFEITEYSGLVGKTLNLAGKIFPDYERHLL